MGPTLDARELAGRKLVALCDRAAARDFVNVYLLGQQCSTRTQLSRTQEIDADVGAFPDRRTSGRHHSVAPSGSPTQPFERWRQ